MGVDEEDEHSDTPSIKYLKRVSMKCAKQSSPTLNAEKKNRRSLFAKKSRNYSDSLTKHKSRKYRSGSVHTKSSYRLNTHKLKDRTKTNSSSQKRRSVNLSAMQTNKPLKTRTN